MQGAATDLKSLQSVMQTIEMACRAIQMSSNLSGAEAAILTLKQSPQPYKACKFILEHSKMPDARFQAAAAVQYAALREWGILSPDDKRSLINFCLSFIMQCASSLEGYVRTKVASVAALLMKRGWLELSGAEKDRYLLEVKHAVTGSHGLDIQFSGVNFLEALVSEFSPSTSTAMGLPQEFHEKCRASLELEYLKRFYHWAQEAAANTTNKIIESDSEVPEARVCAAALCLMLQILNWDFRDNSSDGVNRSVDVFSAVRQEASFSGRSECVLARPGPSWRDVLITSGHVGWLLSLYGALRPKFTQKGYWLDCHLAVAARKLIIQLCSLTGSIFPADSDQMLEHHLIQLLSGILPWIYPADIIEQAIECGKSDSEMLDGCRALLSVATVTSPSMFNQLLKSICPFGTICLLSGLMSQVVKNLMAKNTDEETWSSVARDILLDTWTTILTPTENSIGPATLPEEGTNAAASLFSLIVECELKAASRSAYDDDDDGYIQSSIFAMDERLSSYGLIARAAVEYSVSFLTTLFLERFTQLHQGRGVSDPTITLEELYSLLLICGHVLADEGDGEMPLVPESIQSHFKDGIEPEKHPVVSLSCSVLRFAEQCLDPGLRSAFFSPRLMEVLIWFLARWSCTYLMPPESSPGYNENVILDQSQQGGRALVEFFGEHKQGKFVLNVIVQVSMIALISYPGEKDLQALTCCQLLHGLVRRRDICAHLVTMESWSKLAHMFVNDKNLLSLNAANQRSLAQTFALSAMGLKDPETSNQYVRHLMEHMIAYLVDLSGKNGLKEVAHQPDIIMGVSCILERLRGVASASEPRTRRAIYELGVAVMDPILVLLEVYKHESAVVYLLLKFAVQWVDGQIVYLEARETAAVINFCMRLLQIYSSHNIGRISVSRSSTLLNEAESEKNKDLRALLQLLSSLCSKDLVDLSTDSVESEGIDIAQVVYVGLLIITPLISMDLLKYPKLCRDYFSLISHMLEVYPEMVAQLRGEAFTHVLESVDFGLHHQDSEVVEKCLRALKSLASYHYKETLAGRMGLCPNATGFTDANGKRHEGILRRSLPSLLKLVLFEDYSPDLVSSAADALFPLILCEQPLFQQLGHQLIERQNDEGLKSRLANALHSLSSSNQLSPSLDRMNYQRFRKNLRSFLADVRGFLKTV